MSSIVELLPGFNCGKCGRKDCAKFAEALVKGERIELCTFLDQDRFSSSKSKILVLLSEGVEEEEIQGVVDGLKAQFSLLPLDGERSCREDLFPFNQKVDLKMDDFIRYRPLGCPITHFAKVLKASNGILTVHIIGPRNLVGEGAFEPLDIGICMVAAFEGLLGKGKMPKVCQTVTFLPHHCMMGKVHSGVVVSVEGRKIRIEGIDLKVWSVSE